MPEVMPTHLDCYCMYWDTVLLQTFTVIKAGKKNEKLFWGGGGGGGGGGRHSSEFYKLTFQKLATVPGFREHFKIILGNNFWCSNI